jgi:hypothetical protein
VLYVTDNATSVPAATSLGEVLARAGVEPAAYAEGDCFLTVVMRTQGLRPRLFAEALASLGAQTDRDLEVIVVRHRAEPAAAAEVDAVVAAAPDWLRERTAVLDLDTGARGAPLNLGFDRAVGRYIVAFDDDDLVLPQWVATFRALHEQAPGRALRANALRQEVEAVQDDGQLVARELAAPREAWPLDFQLLDHLLVNHTPNMTIAFPREVFHDLGEQFDEALDTTEDWDFLLRAAALVGVATTDEFTAIYRWWETTESSRHVHDDAAWQDNHRVVQDRLDQRVLLLPAGSVTTLRTMIAERDQRIEQLVAERDREAANAQQLLSEAQDYLARLEEAEQKLSKQRRRLRRLRARAESAQPAPKTGRWGKPRS